MASEARAAAIAEARRVLELSARHQIALEFTADGWRLVPVGDVDALVAALPLADDDDVDGPQPRAAAS